MPCLSLLELQRRQIVPHRLLSLKNTLLISLVESLQNHLLSLNCVDHALDVAVHLADHFFRLLLLLLEGLLYLLFLILACSSRSLRAVRSATTTAIFFFIADDASLEVVSPVDLLEHAVLMISRGA